MNKATSIAVATKFSEPYQIIIGTDILPQLGQWLNPILKRKRIAVIADPNAHAALGEKLNDAIKLGGLEAVIIQTSKTGEAAKNFATLEEICNQLLAAHIERDDIIISFGGGAIGDLTALAANLLRRGVRCVHIPTTLLAQTDSAIGGKTGINTQFGKNLIGTFYQPALVLIDSSLTATLPPREFLCGYAEIAKYGIIGNEKFFSWLEENGKKVIARESSALLYAIQMSCEAKTAIVMNDEKETGNRALLNFGHSFGHALESLSDYKILHGEGVAIGMVLACRLSVELGLMKTAEAKRVARHLNEIGLPTNSELLLGAANIKNLVEIMQQDKKAKQGSPVLILAKNVGEAFIYDKCSFNTITDFLLKRQNKIEGWT